MHMVALMENIVKVTRRGQTTIPASIRKKLKIKEGDYLFIETDGKKIILVPLSNIEDLCGILAGKANIEEIKKEIDRLRSEY